jgi:hypothetical protein
MEGRKGGDVDDPWCSTVAVGALQHDDVHRGMVAVAAIALFSLKEEEWINGLTASWAPWAVLGGKAKWAKRL